MLAEYVFFKSLNIFPSQEVLLTISTQNRFLSMGSHGLAGLESVRTSDTYSEK